MMYCDTANIFVTESPLKLDISRLHAVYVYMYYYSSLYQTDSNSIIRIMTFKIPMPLYSRQEVSCGTLQFNTMFTKAHLQLSSQFNFMF
jgi:hypothetical protein